MRISSSYIAKLADYLCSRPHAERVFLILILLYINYELTTSNRLCKITYFIKHFTGIFYNLIIHSKEKPAQLFIGKTIEKTIEKTGSDTLINLSMSGTVFLLLSLLSAAFASLASWRFQ